MFKNLIKLAFAATVVAMMFPYQAEGQNPQCPTRPLGDKTNACASTAFVQNQIGGGPLPTVCYVGPNSQYTSLPAAIAACTSNSIITVVASQTVTVGSTVSGSGVTITCFPGVVITMNPQTRINVNGTHFTADGCQYQGVGQTTFNNFDLFLITADYATIKNNTISNWGATGPTAGGAGIVRWIGGNHGKVLNNNFFSNGDFDMSISPCCGPPTSLTDFLVDGNTMTDPLILGNDADHPIIDLRFTNNRLKAEHVNGVSLICNFLIHLKNPVITNNTCQQQTNIIAGVGGIWSIGSGTGFVVANNVHDRNGFTYEDYSFELGEIDGGFISNNYANATATNGLGMVCNGCTNLTYTGNIQDGWKSGAGGGLVVPGHQFIQANPTSPISQTSLTITGNIAIADPAATDVVGIELNSLVAKTQTDFTITGNVLVGPTVTAGNTAISVNAGAGTISNVQIGPNAIRSWGTGVALVGGVSNVCVVPGWINATTPITGTVSTCTGGSQAIIGTQTITSASANALAVGRQGTTSPAFNVNASAGTSATGFEVVANAAGSRTAIRAISSGTNEGLSVDAKGTGTIRLGATSTGAVEFSRAAIPTASDGAALGSTANMWSDLFLAPGAVINFNNGNLTLTHVNAGNPGLILQDAGFLQAVFRSTGTAAGFGVANNAKQYEFQADPSNSFLLYDRTANAARLSISTAGALTVNNLVGSTQANTVCYNSTTGAVTFNIGDTCVPSSLRFKTDVRWLEDAASLNTVLALQPISFNYKPELELEGERIGLGAEDVAKLDPRLVDYEDDGVTPRGVRYDNITAILIGAVKALKADNDNIKLELEELRRVNAK